MVDDSRRGVGGAAVFLEEPDSVVDRVLDGRREQGGECGFQRGQGELLLSDDLKGGAETAYNEFMFRYEDMYFSEDEEDE